LETKAIYNSQTGKDLESCDEKQSDRKTSISKTRERGRGRGRERGRELNVKLKDNQQKSQNRRNQHPESTP
jgi:hypothetical protein